MCETLMQFNVVMYLTWFCKSNISGHVWHSSSNLRAIFILLQYF